MANLDTRAKRNAGLNLPIAWLRPLPLPDGTVAEPDRITVAGYYDLLAAIVSVTATGAMSNTKTTAVATFDQTQVSGSGAISNTKIAASVSVQGD